MLREGMFITLVLLSLGKFVLDCRFLVGCCVHRPLVWMLIALD